MKVVSKICVYKYTRENETEPRVRFTYLDGCVNVTTFDDGIVNEALDAIVAGLDPEVKTDTKGRRYRITSTRMLLDVRPLPSKGTDRIAFINAAEPFVSKARTIDFGL